MRRPELTAELVIAASLFLVTAAVNLEVPLYHTYAEAAGFGNGLTAVVFAAYVVGLLPVLILLGGISDRLGRKPVVLAGLVAAMLATALMILSPNIHTLLLARVLQGVGVGLSVGAGTAYLAELMTDRSSQAAGYVAVVTSLGFGSGALLTSAALVASQTLVPPSYWLVLLLTLLCTVLLLRLPARQPVGGALLRLPAFPRGTVKPGIAIGAAWAVTGLVIAVVPTQLNQYHLLAWAGPALFLVNGTGVVVQPLARRLSAQQAQRVGFVLVPLGYGLLIAGAGLGWLGLVLLGAAVAGSACYGFTYLGGLAEVVRLGESQRARAVSGYFLCAYLGFGLPSIVIGFLADRIGTMAALLSFGAVIIAVNFVLALKSKSEPSDRVLERQLER
ncbi:MFS transporter [Leptolyngbya sp. FACHB-261]|uniref:MFS transporter n=1 Tax=Leptolyngbya sp. FACHB-261 TaxID=2692806 RepID=UPI001683A997|nr:MFS transporter [Leptolyngbya sp. FACHB-261]MBD2103379.1 MFS transporter [Leptolyngbya sp. FACHB-261]